MFQFLFCRKFFQAPPQAVIKDCFIILSAENSDKKLIICEEEDEDNYYIYSKNNNYKKQVKNLIINPNSSKDLNVKQVEIQNINNQKEVWNSSSKILKNIRTRQEINFDDCYLQVGNKWSCSSIPSLELLELQPLKSN